MQEEKSGTPKISEDVLTGYIAGRIEQIPGVCRLSGGHNDNLSRNLFSIVSGARGIKLSRSDEGFLIDVHVIVEYKVKIPQLAWEIQSEVKREVERLTEEKVLKVNIYVQGVTLPEEEI